MRVLAIDFGEKRIGLAISDPGGVIAQPLSTVPAQPLEEAVRLLQEIIREESVGEIVLGIPYGLDGRSTPQTETCLEFARRLQADLSLPVRPVDERFTSRQAEKALLMGNMSREQRREHRDKIAASVLLQGYLDAQRRDQGAET